MYPRNIAKTEDVYRLFLCENQFTEPEVCENVARGVLRDLGRQTIGGVTLSITGRKPSGPI